MLRNSFVFLLSRTIRHDAGAFMITPLRQYRYSAITNTKLRDNYNLLQKQSQVGFSPEKFALGFLGGAVGSKAVSQGFKIIKDNPQIKEALKRELADTLAKGWEATTKQYPILQSLARPNYIVQNQKGRVAQAGNVLKGLEKEAIHTQREATKKQLSQIVGQDITNANDGRIAKISKKNIAKMLSDKAIAKSVNNGFSALEHIEAVQNIQDLYQNSTFKQTYKDRKGNNPNVLIHRYESIINEDTQALITLKESVDTNNKGTKIYTLELEGLKPLR